MSSSSFLNIKPRLTEDFLGGLLVGLLALVVYEIYHLIQDGFKYSDKPAITLRR